MADGLEVTINADAQIAILNNSKNFNDVLSGDWFADAVAYTTSRELFSGVSATIFAPKQTMTREMVWTVLGRLSGKELSGDTVYADAKAWSIEADISDGSNANGDVTREQLVTLLWRYAGMPKAEQDLSLFGDSNDISQYAITAMQWAVENNIISGITSTDLMPQANATRGQVAQIMFNFSK